MLSLLVAALLLAGAVVAGLPWTAADLARARKGYGGGSYGGGGYGKGGYKPCRRSCQVKKCRSSCGKARRTCVFCAKQDGHERMQACAGLTSAAVVRSCKQRIKGDVRSIANACKGRTGGCNGCCRGDYSAACTDTFSGTSGFGDYFRTVKRYGKSHRYVPSCNAPSTGTGGDCAATCQREADVATRQCGKRGGADCLQGVQAALQQCLTSRCGATTSTTSTLPRTGISPTSTLPPIVTTTTTIPPRGTTTTTVPGNPCAALACDQYDNFCRDFSCTAYPGGAACTYVSKPSTCDDGDACNGYEFLDCATGCQPGAGNPCPQSDLCTSYHCTSVDNVASCNQTALPPPSCDDGNACNGYEYFDCTAGCQPGAGNPCAASDFCYAYECTSINNSPSCTQIVLTVPTCDDGDACNGQETFDCASGVCVQGPPVFCPVGKHCVSQDNSPQCES